MKRTDHLSAFDLFGDAARRGRTSSPFSEADALFNSGFGEDSPTTDAHRPLPRPPTYSEEETGLLVRHISVFDFDDDVVLIEDPPVPVEEDPLEAPVLWDSPPVRVSRFAGPGIHDDLLPGPGRRR